MNEATELFAQSMQKLGLDNVGQSIAVAVSGGGDSVALTLLMQEWTQSRKGFVRAFTVDHGLRPHSREEAENLHKILSERGIRHDILTWEGDKPATHIQERAREARYRLLIEACRRENIRALAVAHNLEDQVETFWMRLSKGSGLDGLAAMAPSRPVGGVKIVRPLLSFSRADLRQVCRDFGVDWTEDPSNENEQFLRVKLRQFEELLASEGLTPQRLAQTLQKLEEAREALQSFAQVAAQQVLELHEAGFARLKLPPFRGLPVEIQRRILSLALLAIAPRDYAPGFEALEQARHELAAADFPGRTLAGCELFGGKNDDIFICREASSVSSRVPVKDGMVWDGRFQVSCYRSESHTGELPEIGILGEEGLNLLRQKNTPDASFFPRLESLPFKVRKALPALWKGQNLVGVPYLNWMAPDGGMEGLKTGVVFLPYAASKR